MNSSTIKNPHVHLHYVYNNPFYNGTYYNSKFFTSFLVARNDFIIQNVHSLQQHIQFYIKMFRNKCCRYTEGSLYARFNKDPLITVRAVDYTNYIPYNAKMAQIFERS